MLPVKRDTYKLGFKTTLPFHQKSIAPKRSSRLEFSRWLRWMAHISRQLRGAHIKCVFSIQMLSQMSPRFAMQRGGTVGVAPTIRERRFGDIAMFITTIKTEFELLDDERAHVVLAQPKPLEQEIMLGGAPRPSIMRLLKELLADRRYLAEIVTQSRTAVLVLPEVALAFSDWSEVDAMVRNYPFPIVLITGFSVTNGHDLRDWLAESSPTTIRKAAWTNATQPAVDRVYNGGWCWIKSSVETQCVAFLKLTSEQRTEVRIEGLDRGRDMLCLEFGDLIVVPLICSDLLASRSGTRTVVAKLSQQLLEYRNDIRRILIVGLLAQSDSHLEWRTAIADLVRQVHREKVNVCLVNWAYDIFNHDEQWDRWRDYSGIYIASERRAGSSAFKSMRRFSTEAIEGAVSRLTSSCVLGGPVCWQFSLTERHIWTVNHGYVLHDDGTLSGPCCEDPLHYELIRFVRRLVEAPDTDNKSLNSAIKDALLNIRLHLIAKTHPVALELCSSILFGECDDSRESIGLADLLPKYFRELDQGLKGLGALTLLDSVEWQDQTGVMGQLKQKDEPTNLLVCSSPDSFVAVKQTIDRWRTGIHAVSPLILFTKAMGNSVHFSQTSTRRANIGDSPPLARRSIAEAASLNLILEVPLDELSACLSHSDREDVNGAIAALLSEKNTAVRARVTR